MLKKSSLNFKQKNKLNYKAQGKLIKVIKKLIKDAFAPLNQYLLGLSVLPINKQRIQKLIDNIIYKQILNNLKSHIKKNR